MCIRDRYIPPSLQNSQHDWQYFEQRYDAAISWIEQNNHAIISNGPFYLDNYSPESRTITIKSFDSDGYPFESGKWGEFEQIKFPKITDIMISDVVNLGNSFTIQVQAEDSSKIHYFVSNSRGETVSSGINSIHNNLSEIMITEEDASNLNVGANTLKIFASSDEVLRPDTYTTSFLVVEGQDALPVVPILQAEGETEETSHVGMVSLIIGAVIVGIIISIRRKRKKKTHSKP